MATERTVTLTLPGPPRRSGRPATPPADRFWSKVQKTEGCWLWTGASTLGYGRFTVSPTRKSVLAHRFAWELTQGVIPAGLVVCHACDTPSCVRPDHLFLGSVAANNADMKAKARARNAESYATHCVRGHAFDEKNTYRYRTASGRQARACKECSRQRVRARRATRRAA